MKKFYFALVASLILNPFNGVAQNMVVKDTTFNPGSGPNMTMLHVQADYTGNVVAVGNFTQFNGQSKSRIVKLDSLGNILPNFIASVNLDIRSLAIDTLNRIYIGGIFSTVNGISRPYLARLLPNGSLDSTFIFPFSGPNNEVTGITLTPNRILIDGFFSNFSGVPAPNFAIMDYDGQLDSTFHSVSYPLTRNHLAYPDGRIMICGNFQANLGAPFSRIIRYMPNGIVDSSFNPMSSFNNAVNKIALQPDGKILVGGVFTAYRNIPVPQTVRLMPNGDLDTSFLYSSPSSLIGVKALALQSNGKIWVGGGTQTWNFPNAYSSLVRLHPDGSYDSTFNAMPGIDGSINTLQILPNNNILLGGQFTQLHNNLITHRSILRLKNNDSNQTPPPPPPPIIYGCSFAVLGVVNSAGQLENVSNHTQLILLKKDSLGQISLQDTLYPSTQIIRTFDSLDTQYEYTVVAIPQASHMYLYQNNVPTYLGDSPNWQNVMWRQASNPASVDTIVLVQSQPNGGSGSAGGNISGGPLRTESTSVEGLLLLIMNMNNEIIDFTYSDAQGDYHFDQLTDGFYKIIGEYINRTSDTAVFEINTSQNNQIKGVNFEVLPNHIQYNSAIGIENWNASKIHLYPNPTTEFVEITLPETSNSTIKIFDLRGNLLYVEKINNESRMKLSLRDYEKGVYIIEIKANNQESVMKKCIKY